MLDELPEIIIVYIRGLLTEEPTPQPSMEPERDIITTNAELTDGADFWNSGIMVDIYSAKKPVCNHYIWLWIYLDPYTYIFYGAIVFVALLLIAMAICCYCKFKPPKEDHVEYHFDITGQSTGGSKHKMSVPIENLSTNRENMGGMTHNMHQAGEGPIGGMMYGNAPNRTTQFSHVNTESHHAVAEYTPASGDHESMGIYPTGRKLHRSGSNATTGSASSDEDVLKGAYGGHITAGRDDDPFPRDKLRHINDGDGIVAPQNNIFHPHNNHNYNARGGHMITPIDMHNGDSRGIESESSEDEYEEEDYYEDDDEDDIYGDNGGHQTIGAPVEHHNYPHNRHHVDGDEQYIVEMITKDQLRRKVEDDLKHKEMHALRNKDQEYASNIHRAQQEDNDMMDDIINEMEYDGGVQDYQQHGQRQYQYYHQ